MWKQKFVWNIFAVCEKTAKSVGLRKAWVLKFKNKETRYRRLN